MTLSELVRHISFRASRIYDSDEPRANDSEEPRTCDSYEPRTYDSS